MLNVRGSLARKKHSTLNLQRVIPRSAFRVSGVQRTPDSQPRFLHHVSINLRRRHVLVSEQFLNGSDVVTAFQEMRGEDCHKTFNVQRSTLNLEYWTLLCWPCEC